MAESVRPRNLRRPFVLFAAASALVATPSRAQSSDRPRAALPAEISAQVEAAEYAFSDAGTGTYSAPNRAQDLRAVIDARGLSLTPRTSDGSPWTFALRTTGLGRGDGSLPLAAAGVLRRGARVELEHGALVEWYANDARGIEQGWTLHARPSGAADAPVVVDVAISDDWSAQISPDGTRATLLDPAGRPALVYHGLAAWDASGRVLDARIGSSAHGLSIVVDDRDAAYPVTIDPIIGRWAWTFDGTVVLARLGFSVGGAGDVNGDGLDDVVVGTPDHTGGQTGEGRLSLFFGSRTNGAIQQVIFQKEVDQAGAAFGRSVAIVGDVDGDGFDDVVAGAPMYTNGQSLEGRAYLHRGSATGLLSTASWVFESDRVNGALGCSVAAAGDVNGDGFADVIVGAYGDGTFSDEGSARVFLGSATGLSPTAVWTYTSGQANAQLGSSVASAGDVNGDGFDDVIVGARNFDAGQSDEGRAFLFLGSATGPSATPDWTAESDQAGATYGESVAGAGDVNGDGFDDVIVGAHAYDEPGVLNAGRVYAYLGSATGLSLAPSWSLGGTQTLAFFGFSVAGIGDVNGDGFAEVAVAATHADLPNRADAGTVSVYFGSATGIASVATTVIAGDLAQSRFGTALARAGDLNGDGLADFLVGSPERDQARGRVQAWLGRSDILASTPSWTSDGNQANSGFGTSIDGIGDVNGDGFDDVVVGAPEYDSGQINEGRAFVYHGSASGLQPVPAWTAEGNQLEARFGAAVAGAGDVNGDGFDDVLVGANSYDGDLINEGRAFLFLGSASGLSATPAWIREGDQAGASFGNALDGAGDVNGDGFDDVIVTAGAYDDDQSNEGRVFVYLGSATGLDTNASVTIDGNQVNALLAFVVRCAGDVNGDGFDDVAIGTNLFGAPTVGRIWVHHGSATGTSPSASWTVSGTLSAPLGTAVDGAGDVDGDGFDDLIVGYQNYSGGQMTEGRAVLYRGSVTGLGGAPVWSAESDLPNSTFGGSVRGAGDVDADGYDDVIVAASLASNGQFQEGRTYLFAGSAAGLALAPAWAVESDQASARLGSAIAAAGDVNGDGFGDVLVAAVNFQTGPTNGGRVNLYAGNPPSTPPDCNGNGLADDGDILFGTSTDVDSNHVPDECEVVAPDPYCFGDGGSWVCPCGNVGANGNGCPTSFNPAGANIAVTGGALVSNDTLVLNGSGMSESIVTFIQGTTRTAESFGDGLRCVSGSVIRLGAIFAPAGQAVYPSGASLPVSIRGAVPATGGTRHYQIWYRNAVTFCTPSTFNFTNGVTVYWLP